MSQQDLIFNQPKSPPPKKNSKKSRQLPSLKTIMLIAGAVPVTISAGMFVWGTLGEVLLPEQYRFSTFIGTRLGHTDAKKIEASLPAETQKAETITAAQGLVQLRQACQQNRLQAAQQLYASCIQKDGVITGCNFQRDELMALPCHHFLPADLSPQLQNIMKQTGGSL
ncbi:hypothetical protein GC177_00510 [bacterium]|nr:hypothetical protein [bacterium]